MRACPLGHSYVFDHVLQRHIVAAGLASPAQKGRKVQECLGKDFLLLVPGDIGTEVSLAQLLAVLVDEEPNMGEGGRCPLKGIV